MKAVTRTNLIIRKPYDLTLCQLTATFCTVKNQEKDNIEDRRAKILGKGLPKRRPIDGVKDIVLVASGKGGVGKSTVAVNLAAALKATNPNNNVGLLDCDVFGPSVPQMMNLNEQPLLNDKNLMIPLINYGIKCMSMGFLVAENAPLIWRGLMVMQALERLMRQVYWEAIDCLVVDTPPGTGDTLLSLIQNLPISGALLVTTPQQTSLQVTRRGANMFQKLNVPIIGIVENMSYIKCPSCSSTVDLFGSGTESFATEIGCKILQKIPLLQTITESGDKGVPVVVADPENEQSLVYKKLARDVTGYLREKRG